MEYSCPASFCPTKLPFRHILARYKSGSHDATNRSLKLTRPLGATLGDVLTKPLVNGGLNLSRISCSLIILAMMIMAIAFFSVQAKTKGRSTEFQSA
jgi:hypothetical protein